MWRYGMALALAALAGGAAVADAPSVYIINGRAMMPVRYVTESFGASITYNSRTKDIDITLGYSTGRLTVGKTAAVIGSEVIVLDVAPVVYLGITYVPVRFVTVVLGGECVWDPVARQVIVIKADKKLVLVVKPTPPGLAKKPGGLPPGLAKKGGIPPGQAKPPRTGAHVGPGAEGHGMGDGQGHEKDHGRGRGKGNE